MTPPRLRCFSRAGAVSDDEPIKAFLEHGCVAIDGLLRRSVVDGLFDACKVRFGSLRPSQIERITRNAPLPGSIPDPSTLPRGEMPILCVGEKRYEISVPLEGAFAERELFANEALHALLPGILGGDYRLNSLTVVLAFPGAPWQHLHRDHPPLFESDELCAALPPYAVNVMIPLVDLDMTLGPTALCPGSHRWARQRKCVRADLAAPLLQRGDCALVDYRTLHGGMPNASQRVRPNLYLVFVRSWFFDEVNHYFRDPMRISQEEWQRLPPHARRLAMRAMSAHLRATRVAHRS